MGLSVVFSGEAGRVTEPVLALLRSRGSEPVLVGDVDGLRTVLAARGSRGMVLVLCGTPEFCRPALRFLDATAKRRQNALLIVVAAESTESFAVEALRAGAVDYFTEPVDMNAFAAALAKLLEPEPSAGPATLDGEELLVGRSPIMQALRSSVRQAAEAQCNVLITGETGTGKELVAQLIHRNSSRSKNPLVCVNCAAIPDALIESELFGHERGAFTGASTAREGKLMAAHTGTIFLDEIGDMSALAQAKVLRAIEAKEIQRLGATRNYASDVRIVAATHHELDDLAGSGGFRSDLYFRLNVGRIHVPPLRERKADIGELAQLFVHELNERLSRRVEGITEGASDRLLDYAWPGNVRELRNVVERVFITRSRGMITEEDLNFLKRATVDDRGPHDRELTGMLSALHACRWNKSKTAQRLNWSRMTLYRKLAKYGVTSPAAFPACVTNAVASEPNGTFVPGAHTVKASFEGSPRSRDARRPVVTDERGRGASSEACSAVERFGSCCSRT